MMRMIIIRMFITMPTCPGQIIDLLAPCVDHQHRVLRILLVLLVRRAVAVVEQMEPGHNNIKSRKTMLANNINKNKTTTNSYLFSAE